MLYGRSLLFIRFKYSSLYMSITKSLTIPSSPTLPVWINLFSKSEGLFCISVHLYYFFLDLTIFFFLFWLTSLSMTVSRSIHVTANGIMSFFNGWVIFYCIYVPHLLHPVLSIGRCLGCFHVLVLVNSASMNIGGVCIHSDHVFPGYVPRSRIRR